MSELLRLVRDARNDRAVGVSQEDHPLSAGRPGRQRERERFSGAPGIRPGIAPHAVEIDGEVIGERLDPLPCGEDDLPALLEDLHQRADADGDEEGDDENRNGAAQKRLGAQQAPIRGFGDRVGQPLDRIGT